VYVMEEIKQPEVATGQSVMKEFPKKVERKQTLLLLFGSLAVVVAGILSGWMLSGSNAKEGATNVAQTDKAQIEKEINEGDIEGLDEAEGVLVEGGIEGEGTHHLEREGGPSKYVYLTSTVMDLQTMVGKKVHVWGETLSPVKASWLMDVVKIKEL